MSITNLMRATLVPVKIIVAQATTYAATHGKPAVTLGDLLASQLIEHDTPENSFTWVRRALQEAEIQLDGLYALLESVDADARAYTKKGLTTYATNEAIRSALLMMIMRGQTLLLPTAVVLGSLEVATKSPHTLSEHPVWDALQRWASDAFPRQIFSELNASRLGAMAFSFRD